jgi:hypothetical protein
MVVNIVLVFFINVMRVKAVVVNLSGSKCSISCLCLEVFLRSYNVRLSHNFLYAYASELVAVQLKGHMEDSVMKDSKSIIISLY